MLVYLCMHDISAYDPVPVSLFFFIYDLPACGESIMHNSYI